MQLKRTKFLEHSANRTPCVVGMEACGGAQHWARELVKVRTMQINELRGLLNEYGEIFARGRASITRGIADALERLGALPRVVIDSLLEQWQRVGEIVQQVAQIETRLRSLLKEDRNAQRIMTIPGVGLLHGEALAGSKRWFVTAAHTT